MTTSVTIQSYSHLFLAELAQAYLAEQNISSEILQSSTFAGCFAIELRVKEDNISQAEQILNQLEHDNDDNATGNTANSN